MAGRRSSRVQNFKVFLLSGFETARRKELGKKIQSLGGKYVDIKDFNAGCTHVICENLSRSEKFLGACATGKWVLHSHYIDDSCIAGCWLDEEQYEWCDDHIYKRFKGDYDLSVAARRWRFLLGDTSAAFSGWKVAVVVAPKKALVIKRLLLAGGADIFNLKIPVKNPAKVADSIGYIFVSANMMHLVAHLIDYGALLVKPEYIADFLIKDPQPDPMDYLVQVDDASTISDNSQPLEDDSILMASQRSLYLTPTKKQAPDLLDPLQQLSPVETTDHQIPSLNFHPNSPILKDTLIHSQSLALEHLTRPLATVAQTMDFEPSTSQAIPSVVIKTEKLSPLKTSAAATSSQTMTSSSTLSLIEVIDLTGSDDEDKQKADMDSVMYKTTDSVIDDPEILRVPAKSDKSQTVRPTCSDTQTSSTPNKGVIQKKHLHKAAFNLKQLQQAIVGMSPITKFFKPVDNEEAVDSGREDKVTVESTKLTEQTKENSRIKTYQETTRNKRKSAEMDIDKVSSEPNGKRRALRHSMPLKPIEKVETRTSSRADCAVQLDFGVLNSGSENNIKMDKNIVNNGNEVQTGVCCHKEVANAEVATSTSKRKHQDELYEILLCVKRRKISHCEWHPTDIVNLRQREDNSEASFIPSASTEIIHTGLEDGDTSMGLWYLGSHISLKTYPQPRTVAALTQEILLTAENELEAVRAYYILTRMLVLHPPITAAMQNVYLHSFAGTQVWQDKQVGAEWDLISKCLSTILTDSNETSRRNRYLFKFVISMLQANMHQFVIDPEMRADVGNKNMLIRIVWCPSYHVVFNSRCRKLLSFMSEAIQLCKKHNENRTRSEMLEVLDGILWMVAMVTECARMQDSGLQDTIAALHSDIISVFVHEIAKTLIDLDIKDTVLLQTVFQSLRLSWLRVGVCQQMLDTLDDYLLVEEQEMNMINLLRIVSRYFFLLPQFDNTLGQVDSASPARVRTMRSRQLTTNVNNVEEDSSMNKENIDKMSKKVNKRNPKGETPLHTACIKNNVALVRKLLKVPGIDVNAKDNAGWTPLHEACNHGHSECVRELLKFVPAQTVDTFFNKGDTCRKVNVLAGNDEGITPLHDAVLNGRLDVCELLLQHAGATLLTQRTVLKYTPLDLCGSEEIYNLLSSFNTAKRKTSDGRCFISGSQDSNSSCEDNCLIVPSDSAYHEVLYVDEKRVYANKLKVSHYLSLVIVLVRNYIHAKDFIVIVDKVKQTMQKSHCEGTKENCCNISPSCSHDNQLCSVCDGEIKEHPSKQEVIPRSAHLNGINVTQTALLHLKEELKILKRFKCYVELFRNHLKKISKAEDHNDIEHKMLELDCLIEIFT